VDLRSTYFELFGLEPVFAVDVDQLQTRWRDLQRQFHPDRHAQDDAAGRQQALQMAAHVNAAHDTLRDPVKRAGYLLQLAGHGIDGERSTIADTDFLMTQMELREQLDEAESLETLDALEADAADWRDNLLREFPIDYAARDWSEAADTLRKLHFMARLLAEIQAERERLEDELDAL